VSRFGILGSGPVAQTLAAGLRAKGHQAKISSRNPAKLADFTASTGIEAGTFAEVAGWGEALVLAVKGSAAESVLSAAGQKNLRDKLIIDTTNPITDQPPEDGVLGFFTGPNSSLLEQLQRTYPDAHFVKAFNSVGNGLMVDPAFGGVKPTMFYCGNDAKAKAAAAKVIEQFGWEGADMGGATAARAIEPLCVLWCIPGFRSGDWDNHAFHVLRR
jgi:8-hydroxy-5-deazaflavin:NADPH oxidoreductase